MNQKRFNQLVSYRKQYLTILRAVHMKCAEANNYFADGYVKCTETADPLYPYYPTPNQYESLVRTKEFRHRKREAFSRG